MPYDAANPQTPDETAHLLTQLVRLGAAIDKELTLMSERMTWLNLSESFSFSAFTVAVVNRDKALALELLACLMPIVGFLRALLVYPALLAAHSMARRLKETRHKLELMIPVKLQINHGQRTLSSFDTEDLQQERPVPAAGFAFHDEAHLCRMLLQQ
jgi:hypothetical protein